MHKNILLFMTDQQRADSLGCYGNSVCRTPTVDAIAERGLCFERAFTPTAVCTPARNSLFTGVAPHTHGVTMNTGLTRSNARTEVLPFSHHLDQQGYRLANIGKWHLTEADGPDTFGFEGTHYPGWGEPLKHPEYLAYLKNNKLPEFAVNDLVRGVLPNGQPSYVTAGVYNGPVEGTFTYYIAEKAIAWLRAYAQKPPHRPFFLACNWFGPHLPYFLPERYFNMYHPEDVTLPAGMLETFANKPKILEHYSVHWAFESFTEAEWRKIIAIYWGYCTMIDEQVGRVLEVVHELDLAETTNLFFTADHGAFVGSHKLQDKGPAMYDDVYRIPLIAYAPGEERSEHKCDALVSLLDLTATFVDLAGLEAPEYFQGRSLVPFLCGETPQTWRPHITAEFHGHHFPHTQRMIRNDRYKLIINPADVSELYDLEKDPSELYNVFNHPSYNAVKKSLLNALYMQLKTTGDTFYRWMRTVFDVGVEPDGASLARHQIDD